MAGEGALTGLERAHHLVHDPPHPAAVSPGGHPAHVGQGAQARQGPPGGVQAVEGQAGRAGGQRRRGRQRPQQGGAPAAGGAHHRHVPAPDAQVQQPRLLTVTGGVVAQANGDGRPRPRRPRRPRRLRGPHDAVGAHQRRAVDLGQAQAARQRGQPHGRHRRPPPPQPAHHRVHHAHPGAPAPPGGCGADGPGRGGQAVVGAQQRGPAAAGLRGLGQILLQVPHGARDVAGAEPGVHRGVDLQVAEPGGGGQVEGVVRAQDGAGLGLGEGPQADPVGQVGLQPPQPVGLEPLGGQQQVDPHGAADPPDRQQEVHEVGVDGNQVAELVDNDQQVGHGGHGRLLRPQPAVAGDVRAVPGVAQLLLTADHLPHDRGPGPFHQGRVLAQVVNEPRHVGQGGEGREGGPALVVHEDHGQVLRGVGGGQRRHQGTQHLGLA